ncbi:hypothetical protein [Escherichia coli]|uniref:hypothetical protein n=1 Tax=Escherichia coli TaxID=562 RepID=UPI0018C67A39|nr:hypothetical protein [Escherichia coli]
MKIEVLAIIAMGLIVFGVHAAGWDWAAIANNMAHAHPMSFTVYSLLTRKTPLRAGLFLYAINQK